MAMNDVIFTESLATWVSDVETSGFPASGVASPAFDTLTSNYGSTSTALPPGAEVSYPSSEVLSIGNGWATWSGGYTGEVVFNGATSIPINLSSVSAFGFQVEPNQFQTESITVTFTLTLSNGQTETLTDNVNGDAGAQFFGFVGWGVSSITITDNSGDNFAFGNFYYVSTSYVRDSNFNLVPAQYLTYNGSPIYDPNTNPNIKYSAHNILLDDGNRVPLQTQDVNGYLVVPADYSIQKSLLQKD